MHRILFMAGPLAVTSFGFMVGLGIMVGAWSNHRRRALAGLDGSGIQDALVYAILGGLLGARLLFVLLNLGYYEAHPADMLNTREGGISWYGAVAGGVLALALFCRARKVALPSLLDVFAPGLLAAQAVGRVGCLLNGCCYGTPSTLPWAVTLVDAGHPIDAMPRHPVQLYESVLDVAAMLILLGLERRFGLRNGRVFSAFLVLYGVVRFTVEFWRDGETFWLGLSLGQVGSLLIAAVAAAVFVWRPARLQEVPA